MSIEPPSLTGNEKTLLKQFLDKQRDAVLRKADGLSRDQLALRVGASTLTLAGLLKHMTIVEEAWFGWRFRGDEPSPSWADVDWQADEDWDFNSAVRDDPDALRAGYRDAIARSDMIIDAADLAEIAATESQYAGGRPSLLWIILHMIEETARHAGHADLLRESIDGATGE